MNKNYRNPKSSNKFFAILLIALTVLQVGYAQDLVVTNNGETYEVYNLEIGDQAIFYQLENKSDAEFKRMKKSDILIIRKKDGTKLDVNATSVASVPLNIQSSSSTSEKIINRTPEEMSTITSENTRMIDEYNNVEITYDHEKVKNKEANVYFMTLGVNRNSMLYNGDISLEYVVGYSDYPEKTTFHEYSSYNFRKYTERVLFNMPVFQVKLKNHTDKTIYVDLGNSFIMRNEVSTPYYIPSITSNTQGHNTGVGMNLGALSQAMNVGGAIGTLANGITVGGGKSQVESTITYSQRIIAIPPKSGTNLDWQELLPEGTEFCEGIERDKIKKYKYYSGACGVYVDNQKIGIKDNISMGETYNVPLENNPLKFSVFFSYSFEENCQNLQNIRTDFYLKSVIGTGPRFTSFSCADNLSINWTETFTFPCFKVR